jgi:hypothetical protein
MRIGTVLGLIVQTTAMDGRPYPPPTRAPGSYARDDVTYEDDYSHWSA